MQLLSFADPSNQTVNNHEHLSGKFQQQLNLQYYKYM